MVCEKKDRNQKRKIQRITEVITTNKKDAHPEKNKQKKKKNISASNQLKEVKWIDDE
jgi:hypothetical protein